MLRIALTQDRWVYIQNMGVFDCMNLSYYNSAKESLMKEVYSRRKEELLETAYAQGITAAMLGTPMTFQELYQQRFIAAGSVHGNSSSGGTNQLGTATHSESKF
jgi:hypothetical protein